MVPFKYKTKLSKLPDLIPLLTALILILEFRLLVSCVLDLLRGLDRGELDRMGRNTVSTSTHYCTTPRVRVRRYRWGLFTVRCTVHRRHFSTLVTKSRYLLESKSGRLTLIGLYISFFHLPACV